MLGISRLRGRGRSSLFLAGLATALLSACSPTPVEQASGDAEQSLDDAIGAIRSAMNAGNFGLAAAQAKAAQQAQPHSALVHLLAAQAEGQLGNAGNSAIAFGRALDAGLENPDQALADPAFDSVRATSVFEPVRRRLGAAVRVTTGATTPVRERDAVRAGNVEIIEDESGAYVRAGDIVLDTRP